MFVIFAYSLAFLGESYGDPMPSARNHLERVVCGTSASLDNAFADKAPGPVIFCIIASLNILGYCMSTSTAPRNSRRDSAAADRGAPRGAPLSASKPIRGDNYSDTGGDGSKLFLS